MITDAERAKEKLSFRPDLILDEPDNIYDDTVMDDNLYMPKLNPWIREIKHNHPPENEAKYLEWLQRMVKLDNGDYVPKAVLEYLKNDAYVKNARCPVPDVYYQRLINLGIDGYNEIIRNEIELAKSMAIMHEGVGICLGAPGSGKSAFGFTWTFLLKYLFGRKNITDSLPRRSYGDVFIFNADKLHKESAKMLAVHKGEVAEEDDEEDKTKEAQWARAQASLLFHKAACFFDEYSDYFPRFQGRNRMGRAVYQFHKKWRHNDLLILGATPNIEELDINMCQKYITHHIQVFPHPEAPNECTVARIYPSRVVCGNSVIDVAKEPFEFLLWGLEPKDFLGGDCYYHLFNTKNPQKLKVSPKLTDSD